MPNLKIIDISGSRIKEIPILPKLERLWCYNTKITEIPLLAKLERLWCYNTNITEIPFLPKLEILWCSYTNITTLPIIPNCHIKANNCVWLNPEAIKIIKLVKLQKWTRSALNNRTKIIHAALHTHRDLVYVLNV